MTPESTDRFENVVLIVGFTLITLAVGFAAGLLTYAWTHQ